MLCAEPSPLSAVGVRKAPQSVLSALAGSLEAKALMRAAPARVQGIQESLRRTRRVQAAERKQLEGEVVTIGKDIRAMVRPTSEGPASFTASDAGSRSASAVAGGKDSTASHHVLVMGAELAIAKLRLTLLNRDSSLEALEAMVSAYADTIKKGEDVATAASNAAIRIRDIVQGTVTAAAPVPQRGALMLPNGSRLATAAAATAPAAAGALEAVSEAETALLDAFTSATVAALRTSGCEAEAAESIARNERPALATVAASFHRARAAAAACQALHAAKEEAYAAACAATLAAKERETEGGMTLAKWERVREQLRALPESFKLAGASSGSFDGDALAAVRATSEYVRQDQGKDEH